MLSPSANYSGQLWKLTKQTVLPPPPVVDIEEEQPIATAVVAPTYKSKLAQGEELLPGMKLTSQNGKYTFIQQTDGNLVLYNNENQPIWASDQYGKNVARCTMQSDGNLVHYLHYNVATWATATDGNEGAFLVVENSGIIVIIGKDSRKLWATNTGER